MGGGASSASRDVSSKLPAESLAKLQAHQAKCMEDDMQPFDMFTELTHKYEELLTANKKGSKPLETGSNISIKKAERRKSAPAVISGENIVVQEGPVRDPFVEDIVGKLFSIHNVYANLTFEEYLKLTVPPEPERLDPECMECKICCIVFENHNQYKQHILHSDLHPKNVMEQKKRMFERFKEGERLSHLAKSTVSTFFKSPPSDDLHSASQKLEAPLKIDSSSTDELSAEDHSKHAKALWRKAVSKVITTRLRQHYEAIVDAMNLLPANIKLYHSDHKYFYNVKCNFVFHFYLHHKHQCIELVPFVFFPPNAHLPPAVSGTNSTSAKVSVSHNATTSTTQGTAAAAPAAVAETSVEKPADLVKACPRYYFNYNTLLGLVMGNHRLTGVITDTTSQSVATVENLQDNEMMSLVNDSVCTFVLSHLKTHNLTKKAKNLPMLQQKIDETLHFDGVGLETTPLFEKIPEGMRPVELHETYVYNQWKDKFTGAIPVSYTSPRTTENAEA